MSTHLILTQHTHFVGQWSDGGECLHVALVLLELQVDIELVLPFPTDDRGGLDSCQVHFVEGQDGEDLGEATLLMGEHQQEGGLVRELILVHLLHLRFVGDNQEAGEVPFIGLDALGEDFKPVDLSRQFATDSRPTLQALFRHHLSARCGIIVLHRLKVAMFLEEVLALHQGDWMRVHLLDIGDILVRESDQVMLDAQFLLPGDAQSAVRQQRVVLEQATRDGVLDGDDAYHVFIGADRLEKSVEVVTWHDIDLFTPEILSCGNVMETPCNTLNGNSLLHIPNSIH